MTSRDLREFLFRRIVNQNGFIFLSYCGCFPFHIHTYVMMQQIAIRGQRRSILKDWGSNKELYNLKALIVHLSLSTYPFSLPFFLPFFPLSLSISLLLSIPLSCSPILPPTPTLFSLVSPSLSLTLFSSLPYPLLCLFTYYELLGSGGASDWQVLTPWLLEVGNRGLLPESGSKAMLERANTCTAIRFFRNGICFRWKIIAVFITCFKYVENRISCKPKLSGVSYLYIFFSNFVSSWII